MRILGIALAIVLGVGCVRPAPVDTDSDPLTRSQVRSAIDEATSVGTLAAYDELLERHSGSASLVQDQLRVDLPASEFRSRYQAAAEALPDDSLAQYLYGRAVIDDVELAGSAFDRAARLDPLSPWPVVGLAYLSASRGDMFGTIRVYEEALKRAPGSALLHLFLGNHYLDVRLYIKAQRELEAARRLDPDNPEVWAAMGKVYAFLSRPDDALELLLEARAADPSITHIYPTLASLYLGRHDPVAAEEAYRAGLAFGLPRDDALASQIRASKLVQDTE